MLFILFKGSSNLFISVRLLLISDRTKSFWKVRGIQEIWNACVALDTLDLTLEHQYSHTHVSDSTEASGTHA